jgi:hypothetical protein
VRDLHNGSNARCNADYGRQKQREQHCGYWLRLTVRDALSKAREINHCTEFATLRLRFENRRPVSSRPLRRK